MRTLVMLVAVLLLYVPGFTAEQLTVMTQDARLYRFQDNESPAIATLPKGEKLQTIALGHDWFMVRTSKDVTGWIQAKDVTGNTSAFRDSTTAIQPEKPMTKADLLAQCLTQADKAHAGTWDGSCQASGIRDCSALPSRLADSLKRDRRAARQECIQLFNPGQKE